MANINGDAGTDAMAEALTDAAGDLEILVNQNRSLVSTFEAHGWKGLDVLSSVDTDLNGVRDGLAEVAEKIGVGGQIVRDAHLNNNMITNASKASLTNA